MCSTAKQSADQIDDSVAERIARAVAERIINGALPPDTPVRQDHVAVEFRASHVPVREAFRKLEASGLLVSQPRRGVKVAPLDPSEVLEVTEMRASLEALALRHAADKLHAEDFAAASSAISRGEASGDIMVWEQANRDFHRAIIVPCGLPRLLRAIDELHQVGARFLYATWHNLDWQPRSDREHRAIVTALQRGNVASAAERLASHITDAGKALVEQLRARRA